MKYNTTEDKLEIWSYDTFEKIKEINASKLPYINYTNCVFRSICTENDRIFIYAGHGELGSYIKYDYEYDDKITDDTKGYVIIYDTRNDSISSKNVLVTKDDSEYVIELIYDSNGDSFKLDIRKVQGYQTGELILSIDKSSIFNQSDYDSNPIYGPIRRYNVNNSSIQSISYDKITISASIQVTAGSEYPYNNYTRVYGIAVDLSLRTYKNLGTITDFNDANGNGILIV